MTQEVEIKIADGVQVIRLLRADKKNALTGPMYDAMSAALDAAETNDEVAAHVFIGSGGVYTAGNDINDFMLRSRDGSQDVAPSQMFIQRLPKVTRPMIAAVDGLAVGVGVTMLLHCDLVYAASNARFQLPFVPLGITPEFGSTYILPLLAGYQRAAELLLLGQPFTAEKAREVGIVTAVVPQESLFAEAEKAAATLAALPPQSVQLTKQLMKKRHAQVVRETIAEEVKVFGERLGSAEAKEAMSAFLEKRKPDFSRF